MTGPAPAVEARGLRKHYGRVRALDGLDLDIPAGSVFGFLGPNGAGKTTTLRLLTGLGHPTAGSARGRRDRPDGPGRGARPTDRLPRPGPPLLRLDDRRRAPRVRGAAARPRRGVASDAGRGDPGGRRARRRRAAAGRRLLRRDAPAPGHRPGDPPPAVRPVPRRARQLAGPGGPPGRPGDRGAAAWDRDGRALHAHPGRRRAGLRPRCDPRPRPARDRGTDRRSPRALRPPDLRARAGGGAGGRGRGARDDPAGRAVGGVGDRQARVAAGLTRATSGRPARRSFPRWWRPACGSPGSSAPGRPWRMSSSCWWAATRDGAGERAANGDEPAGGSGRTGPRVAAP